MEPKTALELYEVGGGVLVVGLSLLGLIKTGHLNIKLGKNNGSNGSAKGLKVSGEKVADSEAIDKRIDRLAEVVQFTGTCKATHEGLNQRLDRADKTQTEMRDDIKEVLKEMRK